MNQVALFHELQHFILADADRRGEVMITCPFCGKESKRGNVHASFSEKGFKCFVCGESCGLKRLAELIGYQINPEYIRPVIAPVRRAPEPDPSWMDDDARVLAQLCTTNSDIVDAWQAYKPITRQMIQDNRLGLGPLPQSRCKHDRLIVPIINHLGRLVGIRGRAIDCECGKWLVSKGTRVDRMPLYNLAAAKRGDTIWLVENPIDALMLSACTPYTGVATYSVSYWSDQWAKALRTIAPRLVVVCFDNDLPGNGGALKRDQMISEWRKNNPQAKPTSLPKANGASLTNKLLVAGFRAVLYDWGAAAHKADIGNVLEKDMREVMDNE